MTSEFRKLQEAIAFLQSLPANPAKRRVKGRAKDVASIKKWWSENIAGFGIGPKRIDGKDRQMKKLAIRFAVYRKLHVSRIPEGKLIPKMVTLEHLGLEIPTDVYESRGTPTLNLFAGEEAGHFSGEKGTAGIFVRRTGDSGVFLVSCAHVFAPPPAPDPVSAIESPMDANSGRAETQVAQLEDTFPLEAGGVTNACDAALARMLDGIGTSNNIPGVTAPTSLLSTSEDLREREAMQFGAVTQEPVTGLIREMSCNRDFAFRGRMYTVGNLVRYDVACTEGDSGAAVVDKNTGEVLGIHMGSNKVTGDAFFSPMHLIVDRFGIELL